MCVCVWTSHFSEHGASARGLQERQVRMFPCCVQWPLGGIFHSAQACALGLGFQGLGLSSLHLLPLLGSIPHAVNLLCGLGCRPGARGRGISSALAPGRPSWVGDGPRWRSANRVRAARAMCLPSGYPGKPVCLTEAQGLPLLRQVEVGQGCARRLGKPKGTAWPEGSLMGVRGGG